jgi:hypothetical protein
LYFFTNSVQATTLQGRDISGAPLNEYDQRVVFLYDPEANITWTKNSSGFFHWADATNWANSLVIGQFSGWRLPSMINTGTSLPDYSYTGETDSGFNVQRGPINPEPNPNPIGITVYSEFAHLWYDVLGNLPYCDTTFVCPQEGWGLSNKGPFGYIDAYFYWTGLEYSEQTDFAWYFNMSNGQQFIIDKTFGGGFLAIAVRPGDVCSENCSTPVPAPATLALMGLGLVGIASCRRSTGKGAAR